MLPEADKEAETLEAIRNATENEDD